MNIQSLEERIKIRAKNRLNRAIDTFKRDVHEALRKLMHVDYINYCDDPRNINPEKWGDEDAARDTQQAMLLLESCLRRKFVYPEKLLEKYIDLETEEIIKLHEGFLRLSSCEEHRDDILME